MFLYSYTDNDLQEDRSRKVWVLPSYQEHDLQNHASGGIVSLMCQTVDIKITIVL